MNKLPMTLTALLSLSTISHAAVVVSDNFSYSDGDVDTVGTGGTGWAETWQNGNSNDTRRFIVSSGSAIFQGGGNSTTTEQTRAFTSAITLGTNDTLTINFTLIRPETQSGRGIGITLKDTGSTSFFIGKKINGSVGLHDAINIGATSHSTFSSSPSSQDITATITYDGANTSIVMSDSNETLSAHSFAGAFSIDGIGLNAYHASTTTNGVDNLSVDLVAVPEPSVSALLGLGGLALIIRRRK
ncbi:PEP-CTERM sorting domain-containing protein [Rubritalea tangerina]|uniref:PEP-CTERM sorting domain-containing protein n=1 Tax=Rubritalea tangerina TaxID=430798 RepID=A0ABW4ZG32_9BACT